MIRMERRGCRRGGCGDIIGGGETTAQRGGGCDDGEGGGMGQQHEVQRRAASDKRPLFDNLLITLINSNYDPINTVNQGTPCL